MYCQLLDHTVDWRAQFCLRQFSLRLYQVLRLLADVLLRVGEIAECLVLIFGTYLVTLSFQRRARSIDFDQLAAVHGKVVPVLDHRLLGIKPLEPIAGLLCQ